MPAGPLLFGAVLVWKRAMARSSTVLSIDDFGTVRCAPDVGGPKTWLTVPRYPVGSRNLL